MGVPVFSYLYPATQNIRPVTKSNYITQQGGGLSLFNGMYGVYFLRPVFCGQN